MRMDMKTYTNGTSSDITITFWTDSRHYEAGHVHPVANETSSTFMIAPGGLFTFDETECNGSDTIDLCVLNNLTNTGV